MYYPIRKRASVEVSSVKLNDDQAPNTKAARSHGRDEVDHREKDGILGKDPTLQDDSHKVLKKKYTYIYNK